MVYNASMLNKLKNEIEACNFSGYNNLRILGNELLISATVFSGYELLLELDAISKMIDPKIYRVEYLNNNIVSVHVRKKK